MNQALKIDLIKSPEHMEEIFSMFDKSGATHYALFGGAVRDADYNAHHHQNRVIKDYDIRVWIPYGENLEGITNFVSTLEKVSGTKAHWTPAPFSDRPRYILMMNENEIDLSFAHVDAEELPEKPLNVVAIDCIMRSSAGISAIAVDGQRTAWARPEYLQDRDNLTLTVYKDDDVSKQTAYSERMLKKFPNHKIVFN